MLTKITIRNIFQAEPNFQPVKESGKIKEMEIIKMGKKSPSDPDQEQLIDVEPERKKVKRRPDLDAAGERWVEALASFQRASKSVQGAKADTIALMEEYDYDEYDLKTGHKIVQKSKATYQLVVEDDEAPKSDEDEE